MFIMRMKNLQATTLLGVYDWEKEAKRLVVFNIELQIEDSGAGKSDNMKDAVDYAMIEQHILSRCDKGSYQLIERLITDIGALILSLDTRILQVTIEADKPGALRQAQSVSLAATFSR